MYVSPPVVLPEGTGSDETPQRTAPTTLIVVALAALGVGAFAVNVLTSPDGQAIDTTTSTTVEPLERPLDMEDFSVDQIARGTPFDWRKSVSSDEAYPVAIVNHLGWTYVFATSVAPLTGYQTGGLQAWRSEEGATWESLGEVIAQDHAISHVIGTGTEIVAVGPSGPGEGLTVWRSNDGIEWTAEEIEVDGLTPNLTVSPHAVSGEGDRLIIATRLELDVSNLIREVLTGVVGHDVSPTSYGWSPDFDSDSLRFEIHGPFGFALASIDGDDLGLTAEEEEMLRREYTVGGAVEIWVTTDREHWLHSEFAGSTWIESLHWSPTGQIFATGYDTGSRIWTSADGVQWEQATLGLGPEWLIQWRDQLVGPSSGSVASIVTSADGDRWESLGPESFFPRPIQWDISTMAAGPAGIGAIIEGWGTGQPSFDREEPVTIQDGDATLILDFSTATYSLKTPEGSFSWSMTNQEPPHEIHVDLTSERFTFTHPETGEALAMFGFDEIIEAERAYWPITIGPDRHRVFAFTKTAAEWTIQEIDHGAFVTHIGITETYVIATAIGTGGRFDPTASPGFEIWSAAIP